MTYPSPICLKCKHFDQESFHGLFCTAFPNKIPDEILFGGNPHKKPLKDQGNDIVFESFK